MAINTLPASDYSAVDSGATSSISTDGTLGTNSPIDEPARGISGASHRVQVPIAVVGMGCRLPGHSNSPTALWEFLQRGGIAKNEPPPSRFSLAGHYDAKAPGRPRTMKSPGGMWMEDVDPAVFDGQFFNISRTDCIAMDPQQRQILEVTYECLENAGIPLEVLSGTKTGVLVGANFIDYGAIQNRDPEDRAESITIGLASAILSNRVSHFLNVNGPRQVTLSPCSASLVSVDVACRYLDSFQADGMIVAGTNLWLAPEHNEEVGMMRMTMSGSGKCHSFDAKADGYVKAEGVNAVYLKRLEDAIRDGDPIRSILRGTATNASGRTAGLANPSPDMQAAVTRMAYKNAGITNFRATQYLECHGTGTLAGDPVEVKGAASVFAAGRVEQGQELVIGSIKSNIGHSEGAAGLSGLIKATMAVEKGVIPGNPTFIQPNPNIDWKTLRVKATRTSIKWPSTLAVRRASVNSFGFGGANAHAVIENALISRHVSSYKQVTTNFFDDDDDEDDEDTEQNGADGMLARAPSLLVFSANDQGSLKNYVKALSSHLLNPMVDIKLNDLAYTLSERRTRHYHRAYALTRHGKIKIDQTTLVEGKQASSPPKIGFVFTGQGAQWSQMGADLVRLFPAAKRVIQELDNVLQALPDPPSWTLLRELTEPRSAEALRKPEFSQPLVTALQLALVQVLQDWGIQPRAVVGHSSGEIAAAAAAGLITRADAIKTAFYRGQASKKIGAFVEPVSMLAVGVGASVVEKYLEPGNKIQIACYNSPSSLTMSGTVSALEVLRQRLQDDGHFARILLVDLAYHSDYMAEIGNVYEQMLQQDSGIFTAAIPTSSHTPSARMFSSVYGSLLQPGQSPDAAYWKRNMISPVRFDQAATALLGDATLGADFLIELGPSNALSGPIAQIKKNISSDAQYTSVLKRGADSALALYNTAGQLFLSGGTVDIAKVNRVDSYTASVVVDLPNYVWNHSTRYWHETRASTDWRFKKFVNHDLLGSKVPGTGWRAPVFKKVLKLADVPWLNDHMLGSQVVFPATAYVAMAVEAVYQTAMVTQWKEKAPPRYRFRLRDVRLRRAMVLEADAETRLTLALTPVKGGSIRTWYEFTVCSVKDGLSDDAVHSTGLVCVETDYQDTPRASGAAVAPLDLPTPSRAWYKALADLGYNFGSSFQKHVMVETTLGQRKSRSAIDMVPPPSTPLGQSSYPLHPAVMDAIFQSATPALWKGELPTEGAAVLVPKIIDSIIVETGSRLPVQGIALASAAFLGVGNADNPRNYATSVQVYDPADGVFLFEMKGLTSAEIETSEVVKTPHPLARMAWDADIDMLMVAESDVASKELGKKTMQQAIDLVAHKRPGLRVLEVNLGHQDASSLWMGDGDAKSPIRGACSEYHFAVREPKILINAQEQLASRSPSAQFRLVDASKPAAVASGGATFDLVIVKASPSSGVPDDAVIKSLVTSVGEAGFVITSGICETTLRGLGKTTAIGENAFICQKETLSSAPHLDRYPITHVSLLDRAAQQSFNMSGILDALLADKWDIRTSSDPLQDITSAETTVLVLDELFSSVMDSPTDHQWDILKHLIQQRVRILWVTAGAHLAVTDPTKAAVAGVFRTVRAEEQLNLMTLDVTSPTGKSTPVGISTCLVNLATVAAPATSSETPIDSEFVERDGILHIARLVPDESLTASQSDDVAARSSFLSDLHSRGTLIQLRCERLGNLDAVHFGEVASEPAPLPHGMIEVEVHAAGLNYKDVVVTMGIVPGDESALGHEAAGMVRRTAPGIEGFAVGDRVVIFGKGCFANRIVTTPARAHRIPDGITFDEAATLPVVYLTSIHSLFDLGELSAGKSVLIHSAAGGVGTAAIQLAKYVGAEVFATVGTQEKREYLKSTFGLTDDRIFNSRNTDFAAQVLAATGGKGIDLVLNSLTGDMLDESFRILADGGVMVEIGKKDILDRNALSMAPFDRNISFRAVDLSPERTSDALVARLMSKLFELVEGGYIKPINPIHRFSWAEIPSALRFLRPGTHIGKVVLSDAQSRATVQVPIRRAPQNVGFREDRSYLIVGGLRGLCGTLAIYMAKSGAKHLAVMSRSGYADDKSRQVIKQISELGAHIDLLTADVTIASDVERAFQQTKVPVAGIIQGAMVLRDRPFDSMTLTEYHESTACKIRGTWNLHAAAESVLPGPLEFFTLLSSIMGTIGRRGQANYAAANVFLDAFANFRRARGQSACALDLGVVEDAGVLANDDALHAQFDPRVFPGINDALLRRVLRLSLLQQQQQGAVTETPSAEIITGLSVPQPADSPLRRDARFATMFTTAAGDGPAQNRRGGSGGGDADVQALLLLLRSEAAEPAARLKATIEVINGRFMRLLRLAEPMDPARPLAVYGIDSLSAVEVRNWVRAELGALVSTLDILNAGSLTAFCEKIILKFVAEDAKK